MLVLPQKHIEDVVDCVTFWRHIEWWQCCSRFRFFFFFGSLYSGCISYWLNEWMKDWLAGRVNKWLAFCRCCCCSCFAPPPRKPRRKVFFFVFFLFHWRNFFFFFSFLNHLLWCFTKSSKQFNLRTYTHTHELDVFCVHR